MTLIELYLELYIGILISVQVHSIFFSQKKKSSNKIFFHSSATAIVYNAMRAQLLGE